MPTTNKALTQFLQSMKKNLKNEHSVDVPYSALKACYLQANGEHPHAFASKDKLLAELAEKKALVAQASMFFSPENDFGGKKLAWLNKAGLVKPTRPLKPTGPGFTLHLVDDDYSCLSRLALDAEGKYLVPEDYEFPEDALVLSLAAEIPSVRKYGFTDYLEHPEKFFGGHMGLKLAPAYTSSYKDLGDDSGDSASLQVEMKPADWLLLIQAVEAESPGVNKVLGSWVELSGQTFGDMPSENRPCA